MFCLLLKNMLDDFQILKIPTTLQLHNYYNTKNIKKFSQSSNIKFQVNYGYMYYLLNRTSKSRIVLCDIRYFTRCYVLAFLVNSFG